jgi:hypothetical protein
MRSTRLLDTYIALVSIYVHIYANAILSLQIQSIVANHITQSYIITNDIIQSVA